MHFCHLPSIPPSRSSPLDTEMVPLRFPEWDVLPRRLCGSSTSRDLSVLCIHTGFTGKSKTPWAEIKWQKQRCWTQKGVLSSSHPALSLYRWSHWPGRTWGLLRVTQDYSRGWNSGLGTLSPVLLLIFHMPPERDTRRGNSFILEFLLN